MPSFTETITVNGQDMEIYSAIPEGSGPFPAVVVAHHGSGADEFSKAMTDRLAEAGYVAVCPNLFHRITPEKLADGSRPISHMSDPDIIADLDATVEFLRSNSAIRGDRIGVTGFCMGGRISYLAAAATDHFAASAPYYGGNTMVIWGKGEKSPFDLSDGINCPVLFHFGEVDGNPSQDDMKKMDAELTRLGKDHEFHTYAGADHGFMDFTGQRHNQAASETSWERTLAFFAAHLKD
jgi:carboxymethylenebutenolidase